MPNYFDISEFLIDVDAKVVPIHVVQKIDKYHKPILNSIRHYLGVPVIISQHSGYRSVEWEHSRGRSGYSQHTFEGRGAVDVRSNTKFDDLLKMLINSDYTRICYYPFSRFIHCDFKEVVNHQYFEADKNKKWNFIRNR
jgi:uncharacterized protein YcbK (DUF882 family)